MGLAKQHCKVIVIILHTNQTGRRLPPDDNPVCKYLNSSFMIELRTGHFMRT